jgi:GNAT superfamily N-acetyltransferase
MGEGDAGIRRATPADATAIRALTRAAYARWVPVIAREPKPMAADYEAAVRDHLIDLLHVDGELAGLAETILAADHLMIENIAVAPAFQRCGYGRKLMAHAEQLAVSLGHAEIRLYTNRLFDENVRLYCRLGYRVDREEAFTGGIVVHMSKSLRSRPRGNRQSRPVPPGIADASLEFGRRVRCAQKPVPPNLPSR